MHSLETDVQYIKVRYIHPFSYRGSRYSVLSDCLLSIFAYDKVINMSSRQGLLHTLRKLDLGKLSLSSVTFVRHPLNMMAVYDMVSTGYIFL